MSNVKVDPDTQSVDSPVQSNPETTHSDRTDDVPIVSSTSGHASAQASSPSSSKQQPTPKYSQLLSVIEKMGKDIKPTYAGSRSSAERLKREIIHARILVRECLMEAERGART